MATQELTQIHLPYGTIIFDKCQRLGDVSSLNDQELQARYDRLVCESSMYCQSHGEYPVSNPAIQAMYTESVELGLSSAYNIPLVFTAKEHDLEPLLDRLETYLKCHEIYRYCLHRPKDVIMFKEYTKLLNVKVKVYHEQSLVALRQRLQSLILKPFNLEEGPLFEVYRIKVKDTGDDVVLLVFHHTIIDGEGVNQLRTRLSSQHPITAVQMSEYTALSQRMYQYDSNSLQQYVKKLKYDELAASHLQWESARWVKHRHTMPSNALQSLRNLCREEQSTLFARLFSLAAQSFKATFPQRESVVMMIPYSNRENAQAMNMSGCLINSVLVQIELESLDQLVADTLFEVIRSSAAFPLHEVMFHSRMQPDILLVHHVLAHPSDLDLDDAVYNLKSVYPSSIEIREFSDQVDILLGSDGQACTKALADHFLQCLEIEEGLSCHESFQSDPQETQLDVTVPSGDQALVENIKAMLASSMDLGNTDLLDGLTQDDDLFLWGLNSIKGIRFSRALSDRYSVPFSLRALLKLRSLNKIAQHIVKSGERLSG
ncbi:condensation domain-containing protein [Vibrio coralliilyticus]|uniref:Carrier domain-containing protein n=1 Tax=Vibrio coralliilyticus TaxID=190893 RepID=A0AAP6ZS73_9VIBR|nr:hypothetical protein [Vibrio coralliilyticus]